MTRSGFDFVITWGVTLPLAITVGGIMGFGTQVGIGVLSLLVQYHNGYSKLAEKCGVKFED
jgi:hypothetical protein